MKQILMYRRHVGNIFRDDYPPLEDTGVSYILGRSATMCKLNNYKFR